MRINPIGQDPLIGTRLDGRYLIRGVLGRGGMGVVYDGVHEQLGRPVAIKVLAAGTADDNVAVQRFLREARTASTLTHGNIVDVSDLGQLPDGRPYLVMPKVSGITLYTLLTKHGPQTPARVVELLRGAASALDLIHAKGLVHRDVKPENLMHVVREDGSETTLLLDFGIVALVATKTPRLTASGSVFGTPAYLAPETLHRDADRTSDVYSLATVAFELIAGQVPFDAPSPLRLVQLKSQKDPPRLADIAKKSFPPAVEAVIATGLARNPEARYPSAGAFLNALEQAVHASDHDATVSEVRARAKVTPQGALTGPQTPVAHPQDNPRTLHKRWLFAVPAPIVAALVLFFLSRAREKTPEPEAQTRERAPQEVALPVAQAPAPKLAEPAAEQPATEAPPHTEQVAEEAPLASAEAGENDATPAKTPRAKKPGNSPKEAAPASDDVSASELSKRATQELLQGRLEQADKLFEQATRVAPNNVAAWRGLGLTRERLGHKDDALRAFRRALSLAPKGPQAESLRARIAALENGR